MLDKLDQELEVYIVKVDKEKERIALGLKQKTPSPWANVAAKYPIGQRVMGEVVNRANFMWTNAPHTQYDHDFAKFPLDVENSTADDSFTDMFGYLANPAASSTVSFIMPARMASDEMPMWSRISGRPR